MTHPPENTPTPAKPVYDPVTLPLQLMARSIMKCNDAAETLQVLPTIAEALRTSLYTLEGRDLEEMMAQQSQVLNTLFNIMLTFSMRYSTPDEDHIDLALRAQKQCRNTVERLQLMQNKKTPERTVKET
ncbi:MAG: hypothetical protein ACT4OY_00790 [Alphaproteobacteria bacterium]